MTIYHVRQKNVERVHESMKLWTTIDATGMLKISIVCHDLVHQVCEWLNVDMCRTWNDQMCTKTEENGIKKDTHHPAAT